MDVGRGLPWLFGCLLRAMPTFFDEQAAAPARCGTMTCNLVARVLEEV
jgi:hypothetical protein